MGQLVLTDIPRFSIVICVHYDVMDNCPELFQNSSMKYCFLGVLGRNTSGSSLTSANKNKKIYL